MKSRAIWESALLSLSYLIYHVVHPDYLYNEELFTAKVADVKGTVQLVILSQ